MHFLTDESKHLIWTKLDNCADCEYTKYICFVTIRKINEVSII